MRGTILAMAFGLAVAVFMPAALAWGGGGVHSRLACTVTGTNGSDDLHGTSGKDVICGKGGSD